LSRAAKPPPCFLFRFSIARPNRDPAAALIEPNLTTGMADCFFTAGSVTPRAGGLAEKLRF
jgi:hypothetical protein